MDGEFARLDSEFGGHDSALTVHAPSSEPGKDTINDATTKSTSTKPQIRSDDKITGKLIVRERRSTGSVPWKSMITFRALMWSANSATVYGSYLSAGRGYVTVPFLVLVILVMQGSQILNSYTLVWWQAESVALYTAEAASNPIPELARLVSRSPSIKVFMQAWAYFKQFSHSICALYCYCVMAGVDII